MGGLIIGKMNRVPYFFNESYVQDAGGGTSAVETERWQQWANIENRTGNGFIGQSQELKLYDYVVYVRFDGRFSVNTGMDYEDQICSCSSVSVIKEGGKKFLKLLYSKIEACFDYRVTEDYDYRITEDGYYRIIE